MGDETRSLPLIPYRPEQSKEIVLRHASTVVVYDEKSKQLSLRDASRSSPPVDITRCPTCNRSFREPSPHHTQDEPVVQSKNGDFLNSRYFRLLQRSLPTSERSTRPPSIHEEQGAVPLQPPSGAEFVSSEPAPAAQSGISTGAFTPEYFSKFFVEEGVLGKGGKGVVLLVRHVLDGVSLGQFACKRVPVGDDHGWLEKVLIEVQLLQHLSHQNLVSYRHVWLEDFRINRFGPSVPCAFILQQYCNAGDLHHYVLDAAKQTNTKEQLKERMRRRSKGELEPPMNLHSHRRMPFEDIFSFFRDITSGLHHLHANGYIHRDLKPQNCLLHRTGTQIRVLVSDFGEVSMESSVRKSSGATGTIAYCAPEVLQRTSPNGAFGNFTTKSDVFSLGMIVYFMCFGRLPYTSADAINAETEDLDELREEIATWAGVEEEWRSRSNLPDRLYHALKRLLALDPGQRPSAEEILLAIDANNSSPSNGAQSPPAQDDFGVPPKPNFLDELRFSNADSPSPTPRRKQSKDLIAMRPFGRPPGPSNLHTVQGRPTSPKSTANDSPQPSAKADSMAMIRSRSTTSPPPSQTYPPTGNTTTTTDASTTSPSADPPRPFSPPKLPLALPPPPPRPPLLQLQIQLATLLCSPLFKLALFLAKYVSLTYPCAPYAPDRYLAALAMVLAVLDFVPLGTRPGSGLGAGAGAGMGGTVALAVAHIFLLWGARGVGRGCEGRAGL